MAFIRVLLFCTCALFAGSLQAGIILYDNVNDQADGADTLATPTYNSFSTGVNSGNLSRLQLLLLGGRQQNGSFDVNLYADENTNVGGYLATLGFIGDQNVSGRTLIDLQLAANTALTASTRYWIGLIPTDSDTRWSWTFTTTGTGVSDEYFSVFGFVLPCSEGCYQMEVELTPVAGGVPEPSTWGLGLAAMLVAFLVLVSRRRISFMAVHQGRHYDTA